MNTWIRSRLCLLVVSIAMMAACSEGDPQPQTNANQADRQTAGPPLATGSERSNANAMLAGTAWQLVKIMSMDDRVDEPADRSLYTLVFGADGNVSLRADCNRGTGTWTSESAGQLGFGPLATTRAMCPPGSLFDRYIAQFEWVRSYIIKDGHLFLATMADGSIIEFEPMPGE